MRAQGAVAIDVCSVLDAAIKASVVSYHPRNLTSFVVIDGLQSCGAATVQLDLQFAKAVSLRPIALASDPLMYRVEMLPELIDSYGSKVVLGNIWLRLASSPQHWVKIDAGPHGGSHNFTEQVIRR